MPTGLGYTGASNAVGALPDTSQLRCDSPAKARLSRPNHACSSALGALTKMGLIGASF